MSGQRRQQFCKGLTCCGTKERKTHGGVSGWVEREERNGAVQHLLYLGRACLSTDGQGNADLLRARLRICYLEGWRLQR